MLKKTKLMLVMFAAALFIALPMQAFAATLTITQQGENGGTNPASHVVVKDADSNIVSEFDYPGGDAQMAPVEVEVGKEYTVSATADGFDFKTQKGMVSQDADYPVTLTAVKSSKVNVTFTAEGVSDYSGISVSLHQGADTSTAAKATATTDATGKVTFESVPHGSYTMAIVVPSSLSGAGFPVTQVLTVPEEGTAPVEITINGTAAAPAQENNQPSSEQPSSSSSTEQPSSSSSSQDNTSNTGSKSSTESMSKTGETGNGTVVALGMLLAVMVVGAGIAYSKSKK